MEGSSPLLDMLLDVGISDPNTSQRGIKEAATSGIYMNINKDPSDSKKIQLAILYKCLRGGDRNSKQISAVQEQWVCKNSIFMDSGKGTGWCSFSICI